MSAPCILSKLKSRLCKIGVNPNATGIFEMNAVLNQDEGNAELAGMRPHSRWFTAGLICLSLAALAVRLYAASDAFWLDEIIAYFLAMNEVHSARDIFFGIKIEHHFLVTLEMWLAGDRLNWLWYRLPSVLAGTGMIIVSGRIAARRLRTGTALVIAAMVSVSYPIVVYSSEARGYAPAAFFSLLAFSALDSWLTRRSRNALATYWLAMITAVFYHSTAVCVLLSLGLWSVAREYRKEKGILRLARNLTITHGLIVSVLGILYITVMRHWQTMGGDIQPLLQVINDTVSFAMGAPAGAMLSPMVLPITAGLIATGAWANKTYLHSGIWIFHISLLLVAPAIMLIASSRQYVYVRYFLIMFPFFYLMIGEIFDKFATRGTLPGIAVILLATGIIAGNCLMTADFLRTGRGGYLKAVQYMADRTPWPEIIVGGDHDFRNETTIRFYSRYLPPTRRITYLRQEDWPTEGPDWSIIQSAYMESYVPQETVQARGGTYRLMKSYPCSNLSGLNWHLYMNETKFSKKSEIHKSP